MTDLSNPTFQEEDRKAFEKQRKQLKEQAEGEEEIGDPEKGLVRTDSSKGLKYLHPKDVPNFDMFNSSNLNAIKKVKKVYKSSVYSEKESVGESHHESDVDYDDDDNVIPNKSRKHRRAKSQGRREMRGDGPSKKLTRKDKIELLEREKAEVERKIQLLEQRRKQRISLKKSSTPKTMHKKGAKGLVNGPVKPVNDREILTSLHARAEGGIRAPSRSGIIEGEIEDVSTSKFGKMSRKSQKKKKRRKSKQQQLEVFSSMELESSQIKSNKRKERQPVDDIDEQEMVEGARRQREMENIARPQSRKSKKRPKSTYKSKGKREKIKDVEDNDFAMNPIQFSEDEEERPRKKKKKRRRKQQLEESEEVVSQPPEYKSSIGDRIRKTKKKKRKSTKIKEETESIFNPQNKQKLAELKKKFEKKSKRERKKQERNDVRVIDSFDDGDGDGDNSWDEFD